VKNKKVAIIIGVILVAVVAVGASVWSAGRDEVTEPTEVVEQLTPYEEVSTEEIVESISDLDTTPEEFKWKDVEATDQKYIAGITSVSLYAEPREDAEVVGTVDLGTIFVFDNLTEDMEGNALDFGKLTLTPATTETETASTTIESTETSTETKVETESAKELTGYIKISEVLEYEEHEMSEAGKKAQEEAQKQQQSPTQPVRKKRNVNIVTDGSRPGDNESDEEVADELRKLKEELGVGYE